MYQIQIRQNEIIRCIVTTDRADSDVRIEKTIVRRGSGVGAAIDTAGVGAVHLPPAPTTLGTGARTREPAESPPEPPWSAGATRSRRDAPVAADARAHGDGVRRLRRHCRR